MDYGIHRMIAGGNEGMDEIQVDECRTVMKDGMVNGQRDLERRK